jgi:hypothetical protein
MIMRFDQQRRKYREQGINLPALGSDKTVLNNPTIHWASYLNLLYDSML